MKYGVSARFFSVKEPSMKKTKVYLDTSFINYLAADRLPEKMQDTLDLWEILVSDERFEIVLSEIVDQEIQPCYEPKRTRLLDMIAENDHVFVELTKEIIALADCYVEFGVLDVANYNDLLHIATATISECKLIISWNFKHFVNFATMDRVNAVNLVEGYEPIRIVSPSMLLGELENERRNRG